MPRPELLLYRQLPIAYKHRCLLLDVSTNTEDEIELIVPRITSGFTGMISSYSQLAHIAALQQSAIPHIVTLGSLAKDRLDCTVEEAKALDASAMTVTVGLGQSSSADQLRRLSQVMAAARSAKLTTIAEIHFAQHHRAEPELAMVGYALRLSADYNVHFLRIDTPTEAQDITKVLDMAGSGSMLVDSSITSPPMIKRILAAGAGGIVVSLSDLLSDPDPNQTAYGLGEAVFGPGSYQIA